MTRTRTMSCKTLTSPTRRAFSCSFFLLSVQPPGSRCLLLIYLFIYPTPILYLLSFSRSSSSSARRSHEECLLEMNLKSTICSEMMMMKKSDVGDISPKRFYLRRIPILQSVLALFCYLLALCIIHRSERPPLGSPQA